MSARKLKTAARTSSDRPLAPQVRVKKKLRGPRVRLTHIEVHRGETLRLRIAVADDALADVGDELGMLLKKIAPNTRTSIVEELPVATEIVETQDAIVTDFVISQKHADNDVGYHDGLREYLTGLFSTLCDQSLADALEIVRDESTRRIEGGN